MPLYSANRMPAGFSRETVSSHVAPVRNCRPGPPWSSRNLRPPSRLLGRRCHRRADGASAVHPA